MLARAYARMGLLNQAIERANASLDVANSLEHPPSIAYATFWAGWTRHARGEFDKACDHLEAAMELSRKHGLLQFLEWSRVFHGSSLAHIGSVMEGIAEMRLSLENQLSMRCMLERPFCLTLLAEALLFSGAYDEALKCCDEAIEISQRTDGKSYETETTQIRERALRALARPAGND